MANSSKPRYIEVTRYLLCIFLSKLHHAIWLPSFLSDNFNRYSLIWLLVFANRYS